MIASIHLKPFEYHCCDILIDHAGETKFSFIHIYITNNHNLPPHFPFSLLPSPWQSKNRYSTDNPIASGPLDKGTLFGMSLYILFISPLRFKEQHLSAHDRVVLEHAERPARTGAYERLEVTGHGHADDAHGNGARLCC